MAVNRPELGPLRQFGRTMLVKRSPPNHHDVQPFISDGGVALSSSLIMRLALVPQDKLQISGVVVKPERNEYACRRSWAAGKNPEMGCSRAGRRGCGSCMVRWLQHMNAQHCRRVVVSSVASARLSRKSSGLDRPAIYVALLIVQAKLRSSLIVTNKVP